MMPTASDALANAHQQQLRQQAERAPDQAMDLATDPPITERIHHRGRRQGPGAEARLRKVHELVSLSPYDGLTSVRRRLEGPQRRGWSSHRLTDRSFVKL